MEMDFSVRMILFLESRIKKTQIEIDEANSLDIKITKGAKLKTYKEVLEFTKTHSNKQIDIYGI